MTILIARDATLKMLRDSIAEHLDIYRSGEFTFLGLDTSLVYEIDIEIDAAKLKQVRVPEDGDLFEAHNCKVMHEYLSGVSPYVARDERLWVYMTHTALLEYTRARWPIPADDEKAVTHIRRHFFAQTNRQIERDNAASRLWWMAHLCHRVPGLDFAAALQAFLFRSDVRANIVERPTVAQSVNVFSIILSVLMVSYEKKQSLFDRHVFRKFMMEINSVGGFKLLDCLPANELDSLVKSIVAEKLSLAEL
jgi:hypothetical protein